MPCAPHPPSGCLPTKSVAWEETQSRPGLPGGGHSGPAQCLAVTVEAGPQLSELPRATGPRSPSAPCCCSQMTPPRLGDTAGSAPKGVTCSLMPSHSSGHRPIPLRLQLWTQWVYELLCLGRGNPGHCPPGPQLPRTVWVFPPDSTHVRVCVPPAPLGCQPCWTPPVAPCSWRTCRRPEGQACSRPGPCEAAVRASPRTGPGLAGRVAGEVRRGPPPLPDALVRSYGLERSFSTWRASTHQY